MYIKNIKIKNFRKITNLELGLNENFNFIIWGNDSWKTALIDSLKLVLGTVSNDYIRLDENDFNNPLTKIVIEIILSDFTEEQASRLVDWGGEEDWKFLMKIRFEADRNNQRTYTYLKAWTIHPDDEWKNLEPDIRNLLNCIYLKPLRDAQKDLTPWRNSRLSQILLWHKYFNITDSENHSLETEFKSLNTKIKEYFDSTHNDQTDVINDIINGYFKKFMWDDHKNVSIDTWNPNIKDILEKLMLKYEDRKPWLWTSNLLFIASELLLLNERAHNWLWVALIEELEAHIHPQKQLTLINYLQEVSQEKWVQLFITSHSPNIASKVDLKNVIIAKKWDFFPLSEWNTLLDVKDYKYLEKFLDVTKADLFFAKWLIFVEWIAEATLLPVIAETLWINLDQKWISIININWLSFERYKKIFINKGWNAWYLWIKIAIITDRDWRKNVNTDTRITKTEFDTLVNSTWIDESTDFKELDPIIDNWIEDIKTFFNNIKTLEYDLGLGIFFQNLFDARKKVKSYQNEADITWETDKYKKSYKLYKKIEDIKWDVSQELAFIWESYKNNKELEKKLIKDWIDVSQESKRILSETMKSELATNFKTDKYIKYIINALEHVTWEILIVEPEEENG